MPYIVTHLSTHLHNWPMFLPPSIRGNVVAVLFIPANFLLMQILLYPIFCQSDLVCFIGPEMSENFSSVRIFCGCILDRIIHKLSQFCFFLSNPSSFTFLIVLANTFSIMMNTSGGSTSLSYFYSQRENYEHITIQYGVWPRVCSNQLLLDEVNSPVISVY